MNTIVQVLQPEGSSFSEVQAVAGGARRAAAPTITAFKSQTHWFHQEIDLAVLIKEDQTCCVNTLYLYLNSFLPLCLEKKNIFANPHVVPTTKTMT